MIYYKKFFLILILILSSKLIIAQKSKLSSANLDFINKPIELYTTAKDTDLRLSKRKNKIFKYKYF